MIFMKTWNDYKEHVKHTDPARGRDIADMEEQAAIISAIIEQRNALGLSQRDLQTTPNLSTLLKLLRPLGLKLTISK